MSLAPPPSIASPDARLAAIVESSDDAIIGQDLDGTIIHWNPAATRLFGYGAEEAIGRHISLLALPGRAGEMTDILRRIAAGERVEHFVTQRRAKDGTVLTLSLTVSPIRDADGSVVGASKIARDVAREQIARRQQALLAAIVDSSNDAILATDLDGIITNWNRSAGRLYGYTEEEAVGRPVTILAAPGRETEMTEIVGRMRRGERVEHFETQRRRKDGTILDISLTVSPIIDRSGGIIGASKTARDIGERKRNEERLRLLTAELDHRAKNVLAVAQSILRLTRATTLDQYVSAVEGRIGALARIHSQVAENRWDGAELTSLMRTGLAPFRGAEQRVHLAGPPIFLKPAAAQVVGVVLHELATNAAKHGALSAEAGAVTVSWDLRPNGDLSILWEESGGPRVAPPERRSFGTHVIERNIPEQLGGTASVVWQPAGIQAEFTIPAETIAARPPDAGPTAPAPA